MFLKQRAVLIFIIFCEISTASELCKNRLIDHAYHYLKLTEDEAAARAQTELPKIMELLRGEIANQEGWVEIKNPEDENFRKRLFEGAQVTGVHIYKGKTIVFEGWARLQISYGSPTSPTYYLLVNGKDKLDPSWQLSLSKESVPLLFFKPQNPE